MISGLRREEVVNCALLSYFAASSGNFLRTFGITCRAYFYISELFWFITQRVVVISYRRFVTIYRPP
jgi:hypothetical protein